jgi:hypothetical protein
MQWNWVEAIALNILFLLRNLKFVIAPRNNGLVDESRRAVNVNSRCLGYEGIDEDSSTIGDRIYCDFFKNQGSREITKFLVVSFCSFF